MSTFRSIEWKKDKLVLLDQRYLPEKTLYLELKTVDEVARAIKEMTVRGAPAIGVAAAYGMVLCVQKLSKNDDLIRELQKADDLLRASRPTAVNLFWALDRMKKIWQGFNGSLEDLKMILEKEAVDIEREDVEINKQIAKNGVELVPFGAKIIHHCNTGSLATVDYGTALGIIRYAHEIDKKIHVFLDETRPRLQGARLSAWEMKELGIPHTIIVDGASGLVMKKFKIDLALVGADRIAANGDTANKIGTYNLAIVAKYHNVPLYVVAPTSTIDLKTPAGQDIPIEERSADEIRCVGNSQVAPQESPVFNPAFDVTPAELISGIITEKGIVYPPFKENLRKLFESA
ncbi:MULTISPECIES: S-methyl-5-thioribose-1-phosphate isomerase [Pseudothermotoga]|uniref:S-methyl-5-thioribose-1-phosphate isomerase n=1 Tax=Pseudothermotoga TaxID=1643951 RepID=UPI0003F5A53E|nr:MULTISPECIES: S-methyl-5-thioribose-1-phosphate isomerase [Pseudothermotoga]KUK21481.1 MAG: Methylthioribose-1-phosphate isomerase 2 [Pseudothermotoga lettingae]MDI3494506.1 methylthioribose-phosphate isomerase [Pseudothermotoga sp.]HBJ80324.1 S-methyl-5-thioribose-1-phosphate isomerase [Pseudothermotoga sp.]HBT25196.1 S-methyl-5-thioribose-1-phosphate isomerase [Pseudothermotoga sp.]